MAQQTTGKFRKKRVNFSQVSNTALRDKTLSYRARGLYAVIQSYVTIETFTLYKSYLMHNAPEGERAFDTAWKELKESGYLKQYKYKDSNNQKFVYEYELLDTPDPDLYAKWIENGGKKASKPKKAEQIENNSSDPQNEGVSDTPTFYTCENTPHESAPPVDTSPDRRGNIYNTVSSNNLPSNIESHHIVSINSVREQLGADTFDESQREQVNEICLVVKEVYDLADDEIVRVQKRNIPAKYVKDRFQTLNMIHVEYVLSMVNSGVSIVHNMKSYLLTALYNAPTTIDNYYGNRVAYDLNNT